MQARQAGAFHGEPSNHFYQISQSEAQHHLGLRRLAAAFFDSRHGAIKAGEAHCADSAGPPAFRLRPCRGNTGGMTSNYQSKSAPTEALGSPAQARSCSAAQSHPRVGTPSLD
jgi:hypothetical protein